MCISFQPGLGNGLLCDWRVLWNLCALGQVNTLIHSPPAESALSVLILFFPSFHLFLLASVFHIHLHACLLPSLNDPALVELFLLSIQTYHYWHTHTPTHIHRRGEVCECALYVYHVLWDTGSSHTHVLWSAFSTCFHCPAFSHNKQEHMQAPCCVTCLMGRDQEIRQWGEHMCLAHYPASSPSSTLHARLQMLRTGGHFHTSGNLSHNGLHVSQSGLYLLPGLLPFFNVFGLSFFYYFYFCSAWF